MTKGIDFNSPEFANRLADSVMTDGARERHNRIVGDFFMMLLSDVPDNNEKLIIFESLLAAFVVLVQRDPKKQRLILQFFTQSVMERIEKQNAERSAPES